MSVSESKLLHSQLTFGVPDRHFLRRAIDQLEELGLESHERGHPMFASLLDIAKSEAEDALRTGAVDDGRSADEAKLLRVVKEICGEIANISQTSVTLPVSKTRVRLIGRRGRRRAPATRSLSTPELPQAAFLKIDGEERP
jgi:hypothetical protein